MDTDESRYVPRNLRRWTMPQCYIGASWPAYFSSGFGQSRDSDALERANFQAALTALGGEQTGMTSEDEGESPFPLVIVVRENHWAVGWVEWIAIHETAADALKIADDLRDRYADYPVLDDELYSELENDECRETWQNCYNERERFDYLRRHLERQRSESYAPSFRQIRAACRDADWHEAARILPCPSDLLC